VAGAVGADVFIRGLPGFAAGISDGCFDDAGSFSKRGFDAPETTGSEGGFFGLHGVDPLVQGWIGGRACRGIVALLTRGEENDSDEKDKSRLHVLTMVCPELDRKGKDRNQLTGQDLRRLKRRGRDTVRTLPC